MIKNKDSLITTINVNFKDGPGEVSVTPLVTKDEANDKTKMYARLEMKKGSGIGYHEHHGEKEIIYILDGEAEYNDNGTITKAKKGDVCICESGYGHSITATSDKLVIIANIIYL